MAPTVTVNSTDLSMVKLRDLPDANAAKEKLQLSIEGKIYDITQWVDHHPGGSIIRQYNGLDASTIFKTFHGHEGNAVLSRMKPIGNGTFNHVDDMDPSVMNENIKLLNKFDEFTKRLQDEGYWKRNVPWHIYKIITTVGFLVLSVYLVFQEYYMLSAIAAGVGWQQLGWLGHDFCHHNTTENRNFNNIFGLFLGNVLQGYSSAWWKDRHNSHHAVTNIVEHDPDIDNIPMLAWDVSDIERCPEWAKSSLPYQAYYFLLLLPMLRLVWCLQSIFFVKDMQNSNFTFYNKWFAAEAAGLAIHWIGVSYILMQMPLTTAIAWFLISENMAGFGIAIVVFFNHYSCEKYDTKIASNFVKLQLMTTRNMSPGVITDWICGGLNYQVEHHLFPTMPRHNLAKASHEVMKFCKENNLPYMCCGFWEGLGYVLSYLNDIGAIAAKQNQVKST